jgi:hypothetical protein
MRYDDTFLKNVNASRVSRPAQYKCMEGFDQIFHE